MQIIILLQNPYVNAMSEHLQTGKNGEDHASAFLETKGFQIIERNWRSRRNEVDIIAKKNDTLHFIEVKTRTSTDFGLPESKVNAPKLKHLKEAAEVYLFQNPQWKWIQFDILSVLITVEGKPRIFMIEDVF